MIKVWIKRHVCQVMVVICYQCFAPISFVVAMLDNILSLLSHSVPTYLCTFCTQLFYYLIEDILFSKIYHNIRWLICYISSYFRSKNKYCRDIVITVKHRKTFFFIWRQKWWNYRLFYVMINLPKRSSNYRYKGTPLHNVLHAFVWWNPQVDHLIVHSLWYDIILLCGLQYLLIK